MKFYRYAVVLFLAITACSKPVMKLPVNGNAGISGINNLSQAYIFFKTSGRDTVADVHKNQLMTTTHWVIHIDKRLPLKKLILPLQRLITKRNDKHSMHYKPGMHLYLSYTDTLRKMLALVPFDNISIETPFYRSPEYLKKYPALIKDSAVVHIFLHKSGVRVNDSVFAYPGRKKDLGKYLRHLYPGKTGVPVFLNTDYNVSYQIYNDLYGYLVKLDTLRFRLNKRQFWYNPRDLQ